MLKFRPFPHSELVKNKETIQSGAAESLEEALQFRNL